MAENETLKDIDAEGLCRRHLRFGWWSLLLFLVLGIVLEALHGFKVGWYLDVSNEARRLMWTLAHTHGTLLALINIAFALTARAGRGTSVPKRQALASPLLLAATILLPGGFFLGGIVIYGGDPGLGVLLVPIGGLVLLVAVFLIAASLGGKADDSQAKDPPPQPARERPEKR